MQSYKQVILPGATWTLYGAGKKYLILQGNAESLGVKSFLNHGQTYDASEVGAGMWARPEGGFDKLTVTNNGASQQTVKIAITSGDAGYDQPVASLSISGQVDSKAVLDSTLANPATVSITNAATAIVAADVTRRGLRLLNEGTSAIRLGGAGVTMQSPMVINPGDYYDETQAPGAAWYGISAVSGQNLRVLEVR